VRGIAKPWSRRRVENRPPNRLTRHSTAYEPIDSSVNRISSGPDTPGSDTPGSDTPGPDTPGPDTPGPDTPGPDTPGHEAFTAMQARGHFRTPIGGHT
jgi:hypothetical protein